MAAKKTTLKHALPDGEMATRTTAREYTHVVVAREDLAAVRADKAKISRIDLDNYVTYRATVAAGVGGVLPGHTWTLDEADVARSERLLEGCTDAQAFAQKQADARVAAHDQQYKGASCGPWLVLSWSGSQVLAEKAARGQSSLWRDVRVESLNDGQRPLPASAVSLAAAAAQGGAMRNLDALQALLASDRERAASGHCLRDEVETLMSVEPDNVAMVIENLRQFIAGYDRRTLQTFARLRMRRESIAATVYTDELPLTRND